METTNLLIYGLAIWRISSLLVNEEGPFKIFQWLRELTGITHQSGQKVIIPDNFFAQVFSCVWCCSLWVGLGFWIFWIVSPELSLRFAVIFSFSAVAILIDLLSYKLRG